MGNPIGDLDLAAFVEQASSQLGDLLNRAGTVLYSSVQTLVPGDLYFLGVNPGGEPGDDTVAQNLRELPQWRGNNYLRDWGSGPGQARLQRRVQWLLQAIGYDLREVCSSNLIFASSRDESGAGYPEFARVCWPVHERILEIVQPRTLIVYGRTPLQWFAQDFDGGNNVEQLGTIPSGHGSWLCTAIRRPLAGKDRTIVGLPHLSRYSVIDKTNVVEWIQTLIEGQRSAE